ncbi:hypothetical protein MRX96_038676 [Rhipicephalus microplus]
MPIGPRHNGCPRRAPRRASQRGIVVPLGNVFLRSRKECPPDRPVVPDLALLTQKDAEEGRSAQQPFVDETCSRTSSDVVLTRSQQTAALDARSMRPNAQGKTIRKDKNSNCMQRKEQENTDTAALTNGKAICGRWQEHLAVTAHDERGHRVDSDLRKKKYGSGQRCDCMPSSRKPV